MKLIHVFTKTPNHKRFNYVPRHFDPQEEERQERERKIKLELKKSEQPEVTEGTTSQFAHRDRIAGSFRKAKKTVTVQKDPSASMIRLVSLLILTVGLVAYLEFGNTAIYLTAFAFVPFYIYLKFRKVKQVEDEQE